MSLGTRWILSKARERSFSIWAFYLRWLILGCAVCVCNLQAIWKINVALKCTHLKVHSTTQKCAVRWRFELAMQNLCPLLAFRCKIYIVFGFCDHANNAPKPTYNFCTHMIYFLWFSCCCCYIVSALVSFFVVSIKSLGCANTSFLSSSLLVLFFIRIQRQCATKQFVDQMGEKKASIELFFIVIYTANMTECEERRKKQTGN